VRALLTLALPLLLMAGSATANPERWAREWPNTDFSKSLVDFDEIMSGGPPKDGIPSIDDPVFEPVAEVDLPAEEPVMGLTLEGESRAYPLRILMWHEIVNDRIGEVPVAVTFCPLCNTGLVFDRRVDGQVLEFGTTGKLRNSDLVMYDRQTESWWQQFVGRAIIGELAGKELDMIPARLESFEEFAERAPDGKVQVPSNPAMRAYGQNPYAGYDKSPRPFLYSGEMPEEVEPLARVVRVEDRAWSLDHVREEGVIETEDGLRITWRPGQVSALDSGVIAQSREVGTVIVERRSGDGSYEDAVYSVDFAFAFKAFYPESEIVTGDSAKGAG